VIVVRVAVLSDIHANIDAFQAVVGDFKGRIDSMLNLGDLVGYNASPNECVKLARDLGMHSILGNHDQAACNPVFAENFNIFARNAILWTRNNLNHENIQFLGGLEKNYRLSCSLACHGSPDDISSYIALPFQARATLKKMKKGLLGNIKICLFGHTHKRKIWRMDVRGKVAPVEIPLDGMIRLNGDELYLLNPGSVGQPRNGDPRSSYFIFDTETNTVSFKLVKYNVASTIKKITKAKLPEFLAKRLLDGT
jgi:diadenosine tetraphosphatase ApaH/serine/threonine PP2A family protein phosphatase